MENSFEIKGYEFKVGKINAFKQFHIVRRMGPLLSDLMPALTKLSKKKKDLDKLSEEENLELISEFISPIMTGLSKLSDEDSDKVLMSLLECAEIKILGAWARVVVNGQLSNDKLDLPTLMQVAGKAFMHNLSGFFAATPQK